MSDFLPFSRPSMGDAELAALREVLASGWITTGPKNQALEAAFCQLTGNRHAIAVSSATGGMHVTLMALGIGPGDEVITPSQTWVSTLNMICLLGATPVMIDVDNDNLMITPAATAPELTARGYKLILRTTGLDSDQGPTAAKYILDKVKPQRIAVVHDKQQYGEGLARAVQDGLKKGGANVVFFDGITAGEKDFSTLVARLKKEDIDFVYYGGYHPEMGQILRQARAAGLKTQFMGPEGVANVSLSNIAGESAEGLLVTKPKNYDQVPANKPIVDAIKAKKQDPSGAFVWTTYAALQSLQAGLNQSDDPAEIAKYLKANSVDTVMGPLTWDEKGCAAACRLR